ncbi:hypothetical protein [Nonomuraea wenchangensis]|uniref:hypothetical protein n=1 Tax=Nonomuraea wenchangensis TaxID=568860 RepID=UPI00332DB0A5
MTTPADKLAALAEQYTQNLMTEWVTWARKDSWSGTPSEFTAQDVIEAHQVLTEAIGDYAGQTIRVDNAVSVIDEQGRESVIPLDKLKAEHIDSAQVCLAAQFHALYAQAHLIMTTFVGLERLREHLAEEAN